MDAQSPDLIKLRSQAIEERKNECGDIIKNRKRKLAELYCGASYRYNPITKQQLNSLSEPVKTFLEQNDLERNHFFDSNTLPEDRSLIKDDDAVSSQAPSVAVPSSKSTSVPAKPPSASPLGVSERMTTRVSSGALRHKSVTEILGVKSKSNMTANTPSIPLHAPQHKVSRGKINALDRSNSKSDEADRARAVAMSAKRPPEPPVIKRVEQLLESVLVPPADIIKSSADEDVSLAKLYYTSQSLPLYKLLSSAHKTLNTANYNTFIAEGKMSVVFRRIEELKRENRWSLRQPQRFIPPKRNKVHWDYLLDEMKWMQMDFHEERKLKMAQCLKLSNAVKEYWVKGKVVCVNHSDKSSPKDTVMTDGASNSEEVHNEAEAPALDHGRDDGSTPPDETVTPISALSPILFDIVTEQTDLSSEEARLLIEQLPTYDGLARDRIQEKYLSVFDEIPIIPISKFANVPISDVEQHAWRCLDIKALQDAENEQLQILHNEDRRPIFISEAARRYPIIRAPQPPSLKYLEYRAPTIWLPQDDAMLRKACQEYNYNWEVISADLFPQYLARYVSNIERRTAWQCFERWLQLEPNFQLSDLRGPYARVAIMWLDHANKAQAATKRRITPIGVGLDALQRGHRRLRWASMFDGIRKCMRKRENAARPNQNLPKRPIEGPSKVSVPTPAELSKLKLERDMTIAGAYIQQQRDLQQQTSSTGAVPQTVNSNNNQMHAANNARVQTNAFPNNHNIVNGGDGDRPIDIGPNSNTSSTSSPALSSAAMRGSANGSTPVRMSAENVQYMMQLERQRMRMRQQQLMAASNGSVSRNGSSPSVSPAPQTMQIHGDLATAGSLSRVGTPTGFSGNDIISQQQNNNLNHHVQQQQQQQPRQPQRMGIQASQITELANQLMRQHPKLTPEQATRVAQQQLQRYLLNLQQQHQQQATLMQQTPASVPRRGMPVNRMGSPSPQMLTSQQKQQQQILQTHQRQLNQIQQMQKLQMASNGRSSPLMGNNNSGVGSAAGSNNGSRTNSPMPASPQPGFGGSDNNSNTTTNNNNNSTVQ